MSSTTTATTATTAEKSEKSEKSKAVKTIYLIRHAESEENRRIGSLKSTLKGIGKFQFPKKKDIVASVELLNVSAQIDSNVSDIGIKQITQLGERLIKDDFVSKTGIELVAHSPLKRARQTSHGMLQTVSPSKTTSDITIDSSSHGSKHNSVSRVIELELLTEKTPMEWLPTHSKAYMSRIRKFEIWLSEQEENVIAIVGHSQYFRSMLGLKSKFDNVDVWSLQFDPNEVGTELKEDEIKDDIVDDSKEDDNSDVKKEETSNGLVTEVDGIPLVKLNLPRGWKQLKHHYRYDPNYTS